MNRTRLLIALAVIVAASKVLPAAIPDPVRTDAGLISGTIQEGVRAYKGIPFAAPPVGPLRFKDPQPVGKWEGVRKADQYGNVCVQPRQPNRKPNNVSVDLPDSPKISEDCLYLNVWTDAKTASEKRPVMVWIFGAPFWPRISNASVPHTAQHVESRRTFACRHSTHFHDTFRDSGRSGGPSPSAWASTSELCTVGL